MEHQEQHRHRERAEGVDDDHGRVRARARRGDGGPEDTEPENRDELPERARPEELAAGHGARDEARVVRGVGEPGDPPAYADGGHDLAHYGPTRGAGGLAGVAPLDVAAGPRDDGHGDEDDQRDRDGPLLEGADGVEAERRKADLYRHEHQHHDDLGCRRAGNAELVEQGDAEVKDNPGVYRDPSRGDHYLEESWEVRAPPTERAAGQDHLRHPGPLPHQHERAEDHHPYGVTDSQDQHGIPEPQPKHDPERPEHPVDRGDVGAGPDPELIKRRRVLVLLRDGRDAVVLLDVYGLFELSPLASLLTAGLPAHRYSSPLPMGRDAVVSSSPLCFLSGNLRPCP